MVDAKTRADINSIHSKLKTIEVSSKNSYRNNNNLNFNQRMALDYLQNLVKKCKIVICNSDKDGKIIIVNFKNYNTIMEKANITLHNIIWPIAQFLQRTIIFKRFIDDIIWISQGEKLTNSVKEKLTSTFQEGGLKLIFRKISTNEPAGSCVEFLDVNHRN